MNSSHANDDRRVASLIIVVALVLAVVPAVFATRRLQWPFDLDAFRDIAAAQTMRDGSWTGDPFYAAEHAWYTPLVPGVVAAVSNALQQPVPTVAVRSGPWLNLFGAIAFAAAAWRLLGAAAALFAVIVFLFVPADPPVWAAGTYSAWLFPGLVGQAFLYLGLILCHRLLECGSMLIVLAIGATIGIGFLAHAAHGVLLASTLMLAVAWAWLMMRPRRPAAFAIPIAALIAMVLIAPFFWPLVARYHLHTLNRAPATWPYTPGYPAALVSTLRWPMTWLFVILAVSGVISLARRRDAGVAVLWSWGAAGLLLSAYSLTATWYAALPPIVPAYHFEYQVRAWGWMLVGSGAWWLVGIAAERISPERSTVKSVVLAAAAVVAIVALYPGYLRRPAFQEGVAAARTIGASPDRSITGWIRSSTPGHAVFLASDDDSLLIVGPAGRHVVAVDAPFSNPYVDYGVRRADRDAMFAAIDAGDWDRFATMAGRYGVTHVLAHGPRASALLAAPLFTPAYGTSDAVVVAWARSTK